MALLQADVRL